MNGGAAIGGGIDCAVGFDIEGRRAKERLELLAGAQMSGQFEVIADVEELDRVLVIARELQKGVRPRGDDAAAKLEAFIASKSSAGTTTTTSPSWVN